jgi:protein-disulfide isomerase
LIDRANIKKHAPLIGAAGVGLAASLAVAATLGGSTSTPVPVKDRAAIEAVVRDYILAHPEIIPEAINRMREKQATDAYTANKSKLETPFASAWAGAEKGDVTLVMFSDYACGYCRASLPEINRLIAEDPKLKVVWREIPILGPGSELAAKGSLAAAKQGKFIEFHNRMFAAGRPDGGKVSSVLRSLGLDNKRLESDVESAAVSEELQANMKLVSSLDSEGVATPTFFVGGQMLKGAVGYGALKEAIAEARKKA